MLLREVYYLQLEFIQCSKQCILHFHVFITMHVMCKKRSFKNFAKSSQTFKLRSSISLQIFVSLTIQLALVQSKIYLQRSVLISWLRFTNLLDNFYEMAATVNSEKCKMYRQKIKKNAKKVPHLEKKLEINPFTHDVEKQSDIHYKIFKACFAIFNIMP